MLYQNRTFQNQDVVLDDNEFNGCTLENCNLIYSGSGKVALHNNSFIECRVIFNGPAASSLDFLGSLYRGGWADLVEATFANIRRGGNNISGDDGDSILNAGIIH